MTRHVLAVLNPISGRRSMTPVVQDLASRMEAAGGRLTIACTDHRGHGTKLAQAAVGCYDAVLAVGGDGTVGEVVNGLTGTGMPIAILGTGTENLLARQFRMPRSPGAMAQLLLSGQPVVCDVGVVNERRFLAVAGIGFDAEVVERLANRRSGHINYLSYFWPVWRTFWSHRFPALRVLADGRQVFEGRGFIICGVISRYSLGMRILARADHADGLLDMCIFPCTGRLQLLWHAMHVFVGRHLRLKNVMYCHFREAKVDSRDRVPVEIDGDAGGELPIRLGILPGAMHVLQPAAGR